MPEESRKSKIQLSRARRRVRRVKTAPQGREGATTGHKTGEGTEELTDFDARHGRMYHSVSLVRKKSRGHEYEQTE